jgi:hypothetical protein
MDNVTNIIKVTRQFICCSCYCGVPCLDAQHGDGCTVLLRPCALQVLSCQLCPASCVLQAAGRTCSLLQPRSLLPSTFKNVVLPAPGGPSSRVQRPCMCSRPCANRRADVRVPSCSCPQFGVKMLAAINGRHSGSARSPCLVQWNTSCSHAM